jgi:hypothetical protein
MESPQEFISSLVEAFSESVGSRSDRVFIIVDLPDQVKEPADIIGALCSVLTNDNAGLCSVLVSAFPTPDIQTCLQGVPTIEVNSEYNGNYVQLFNRDTAG